MFFPVGLFNGACYRYHLACGRAAERLLASFTLCSRLGIHLFPVDKLPADSSRGLEVPGAALTYSHVDGQAELLYTDAQIVSLMLPDLSMPYNVISITSTVFALFVGSMYNLLSRRLHVNIGPRTRGALGCAVRVRQFGIET